MIAAVPVFPPLLAEIVADPAPATLANPALTVATPPLDELQVALVVRLLVLPSLSVPVAVYCCDPPTGTVADVGETAIETTTGGVTERLA